MIGNSSLTRKRWLATPLALSLLAIASCGDGPSGHTLAGQAFGTGWTVTVTTPPLDSESLTRTLQARLTELDDTFSTWRDDTEIARFNRLDTGAWFDLNAEFATVVDAAFVLGSETGGALDITLRPLSVAWGFQGEGEPGHPGDERIEQLMGHSGMHRLERSVDGQRLRKRDPNVEIDLSALAKGFAVDEMARVLREAEFTDFLVEFGGEVLAEGERPGGGAWRVGIDSPGADSIRGINLSGSAVATSGDYRQYFEADGQRFSHVLHPMTGYPPRNDVAAATVIATTALEADALATAFLVLDPDASMEAADRLGVGLRLVIRDGDSLLERENQAFARAHSPSAD